VLALIPARSGSKSIPRKNLQPIGGTTLVGLAAEAAAASSAVGRVVVSTDGEEIAAEARAHGAEAPFLRPRELAADDTADFPVLEHTLEWLAREEDYRPEVVVWLRPTSPLRTAGDIDAAVAILRDSGADCVRSVCLSEHHPYWMKHLDGNRLLPFLPEAEERRYPRRQLLPPVYRLNGAVDVVRVGSVLEARELFPGDVRGYVMPAARSIDVDEPADLVIARALAEADE
jgi:CMP-N-acetylneuraminic acid synthetase